MSNVKIIKIAALSVLLQSAQGGLALAGKLNNRRGALLVLDI